MIDINIITGKGGGVIGSYHGHKDLNEMAVIDGWEAAKQQLHSLLVKR